MLTHVDKKNQPTMVDITDKEKTLRTAVAQSQIQFPEDMREHIRDGEIYLKKGPVFQTALIAGTMAAKKTSDVIPFCHQIPIESCKLNFTMDDALTCTVTCTVQTHAQTGVEMEALHGAMIASLTVYDMCKALSHKIVIQNTKLISKKGGQRVVLKRPLYGLVLTGGKSERMKRDKALIDYKGKPHALFIYDVLKEFCSEVYFSAKKDQWNNTSLEGRPTLEDSVSIPGPMAGILSAFQKHPEANWFIVACDLIHFGRQTAKALINQVDEEAVATCFSNREGSFPEALCAIYTPRAQKIFEEAASQDRRCPVKILSQADCRILEPPPEVNLANVNSPEDVTKEMGPKGNHAEAAPEPDAGLPEKETDLKARPTVKSVKIKYFASLREISNRDIEDLQVECRTYGELYEELAARYHFNLPSKMIQVAVNAEFSELESEIEDGVTVVFIPPVAGG